MKYTHIICSNNFVPVHILKRNTYTDTKKYPGPAVKKPPANAGDTGSILGPEDSTCCKATKAVHHNYLKCTLEPVLCNKGNYHNEKLAHHN